MDGVEATHSIRMMEGGKKTVIVALTASVRDVFHVDAFDGFLCKPLHRSSLQQILKRMT